MWEELEWLTTMTISGDGYRALEPFDELPDKKAYPDYFKVITNPLSLRMINVSGQAVGSGQVCSSPFCTSRTRLKPAHTPASVTGRTT